MLCSEMAKGFVCKKRHALHNILKVFVFLCSFGLFYLENEICIFNNSTLSGWKHKQKNIWLWALKFRTLVNFVFFHKWLSLWFFDVCKSFSSYKKVFPGGIMCLIYMSQRNKNWLVICAFILSDLHKTQLKWNYVFLSSTMPFSSDAKNVLVNALP